MPVIVGRCLDERIADFRVDQEPTLYNLQGKVEDARREADMEVGWLLKAVREEQ
jgi:hypothetical protein